MKVGEYNIKLRALEPDDIDILYKWENDPDIWHVSNSNVPISRYTLARFIESSHLDIYEVKQMRLLIELNEGDDKVSRPVGTIELFDFEPYHNRAGVGILIGDKTDRKKGYASQALKEFIQYSFNVLQLHQLYCNINVGNNVSLKLFKKQGFTVSGIKKDWIKTKGSFTDEYFLQLINPLDNVKA